MAEQQNYIRQPTVMFHALETKMHEIVSMVIIEILAVNK
jgi:hypothetical protein